MKKKRVQIPTNLLLICLIATLLIPTTIMNVKAQETPEVSVNPQTNSALPTQYFTVNINISNVENLVGFTILLIWGPSLLDVSDVQEGDFLAQGGSTTGPDELDNDEGTLMFSRSLTGGGTPQDGNGTLLTVEFLVEDWGSSVLWLSFTKVNVQPPGPYPPESIAHTTVDGFFTNVAATYDMAVTAVTPSRTTVGAGYSVLINVTVQNQGNVTVACPVTAYYNPGSDQAGLGQMASVSPDDSTTVTITWVTVDVSVGNHDISAEAYNFPGETDTADNSLSGGTIQVIGDFHDVAATSIGREKTILCQGYEGNLTVAIRNYGKFTESFNVTVYVNTTAIQTVSITDLPAETTDTFPVTWNSEGFEKGLYIISANATTVSGEEYTDTDNNIYSDGTVKVVHVGDVNDSGKVTITDLVIIALCFGAQPGDENWDPISDINHSQKVTVTDIVIAALHFGETDP